MDASQACLVFCSKGYFESANCVRELLRAIFRRKPIIALLEPEEIHGGLSLEQVYDGLALAHDALVPWGLVRELCKWQALVPNVQQMRDALLTREPIVWDRNGAFQIVTLRLIVERILPSAVEIHVSGELSRKRIKLSAPQGGRRFHIFVSPDNHGAAAVAEEMTASFRLLIQQRRAGLASPSSQPTQLLWTTRVDQLTSCESMLLYLNGQTWTSGESSGRLAAARRWVQNLFMSGWSVPLDLSIRKVEHLLAVCVRGVKRAHTGVEVFSHFLSFGGIPRPLPVTIWEARHLPSVAAATSHAANTRRRCYTAD